MEGRRTTFRKGAGLHKLCSLSLLLMLSIAMFLSPPCHSLAIETSPLENLKERVLSENLAHSREWLLLGHWHQRFGSYVSDAEGSGFFLSPEGARSPEAELLATLEQITLPPGSESEERHAQCRFPARRDFLYRRLHLDQRLYPLHPCPHLKQWKAKLNADGVSLMFASAYMNNAASMFGHTFLKFHGRDNHDDQDLLNYGVSFWAQTGQDGGIPFALFGLTGGYPGGFSLQPFHQTLKEYTHLDGRDVWEYRLNLTSSEIDTLINHLLELQQTYFRYYFLDENCSYQLLKALEVARPDLHLSEQFFYAVIPADTIRVLVNKTNIVQSIRYRPSLMTQFRAQQSRLTGADQDLIRKLVVEDPKLVLSSIEKRRQAMILDAALTYLDIQQIQNPRPEMVAANARERVHALKVQRASLGRFDDSPVLPPSTRPELGHDPARFGVGWGTREDTSSRFFLHTEFRFAYHHLLSSEEGYLENTHLEVGRLGIRQYVSDSHPTLQEFTVFDLMSLSPVDGFFQPVGWQVDFGVRRLQDRPAHEALALSLNGGSGFAFQPLDFVQTEINKKSFFVFAFARLHADSGADLPDGYRWGLSTQLQALLKPTSRFRLLTGTEWRHHWNSSSNPFASRWLNLGYSLTRNWEARLDWSRVADINETKALIFVHFLL